jgi:hypothetical protein
VCGRVCGDVWRSGGWGPWIGGLGACVLWGQSIGCGLGNGRNRRPLFSSRPVFAGDWLADDRTGQAWMVCCLQDLERTGVPC